jgi:hypothetical protein
MLEYHMDDSSACAKAALLMCQALMLALARKQLLTPDEAITALQDIVEACESADDRQSRWRHPFSKPLGTAC